MDNDLTADVLLLLNSSWYTLFVNFGTAQQKNTIKVIYTNYSRNVTFNFPPVSLKPSKSNTALLIKMFTIR